MRLLRILALLVQPLEPHQFDQDLLTAGVEGVHCRTAVPGQIHRRNTRLQAQRQLGTLASSGLDQDIGVVYAGVRVRCACECRLNANNFCASQFERARARVALAAKNATLTQREGSRSTTAISTQPRTPVPQQR